MIGTTLNFKPGRRLFKFTSNDATVLFVLSSFLIGFAIGIFLICSENSPIMNLAKSAFEEIKSLKQDGSFFAQTASSVATFSLFLIVTYFFGTSILGCAILPAICMFKGVSEGVMIAFMYHSFSLSGIGFSVLILSPYYIVSSFLLILACRESVCFSGRVLRNALPRGTAYNLSGDFKLYSFRYIFILVLSILAAMFNTVCSLLFFDYFKF